MAEKLCELKKKGNGGGTKDFNVIVWRCKRGTHNYCGFISPREVLNFPLVNQSTSPGNYASYYSLASMVQSGYRYQFTATKKCYFICSRSDGNYAYSVLNIGDTATVDLSNSSTSTDVYVHFEFIEY